MMTFCSCKCMSLKNRISPPHQNTYIGILPPLKYEVPTKILMPVDLTSPSSLLNLFFLDSFSADTYIVWTAEAWAHFPRFTNVPGGGRASQSWTQSKRPDGWDWNRAEETWGLRVMNPLTFKGPQSRSSMTTRTKIRSSLPRLLILEKMA